jgi:hypothetical protein
MAMSIGGMDSYSNIYYTGQTGEMRIRSQTGDIQGSGSLKGVGQKDQSADSKSTAKPLTGATQQPGSAGAPQSLTPEEKKDVEDLKKRDAEVRAHEQAHIAAGGQYVRGGATYKLTAGPDGRQYATGGEVSIDRSPVPGDPEATIRKLETVRKAALAPATPSAKDRSVAAAAGAEINKANREKMENLLGIAGSSGNNQPASKGSALDIKI